MSGLEERIQELEEKLTETPVNKATETERGRLKARIAELKEQKQQKQKGTGDTTGYAVEKEGDATVSLVGFPSVGKSTLLNELTNAESETGGYEFTTLEVEPGMMDYNGAKIQVLDVPGLIGGAADGRGDGRQVLSVIRNSDLVIFVIDPEELRTDQIEEEAYNAGIRVDKSPPDMKVEKKGKGGIDISGSGKVDAGEDALKEILEQRGYTNAKIIVREEMDLDRFIDGLMKNRKYLPGLRIVNKIDTVDNEKRGELEEEYDLVVSAETGENLDKLKDMVFDELGLIRVYMKEKGEEPDRDDPLVLEQGSTVGDALDELPGDMERRFKDARITGPSSDFPEQRKGPEHRLKDGDVLQLNLKHL